MTMKFFTLGLVTAGLLATNVYADTQAAATNAGAASNPASAQAAPGATATQNVQAQQAQQAQNAAAAPAQQQAPASAAGPLSSNNSVPEQQITGPGASGDTQTAMLDQNGQWQANGNNVQSGGVRAQSNDPANDPNLAEDNVQ